MKVFKIDPHDRWDKDIPMGDRMVRVDNDDVDPADTNAVVAMIYVAPEMLDICYDFVLKCHLGLARSNETYGKMKAVLDEYHLQARYESDDDDD